MWSAESVQDWRVRHRPQGVRAPALGPASEKPLGPASAKHSACLASSGALRGGQSGRTGGQRRSSGRVLVLSAGGGTDASTRSRYQGTIRDARDPYTPPNPRAPTPQNCSCAAICAARYPSSPSRYNTHLAQPLKQTQCAAARFSMVISATSGQGCASGAVTRRRRKRLRVPADLIVIPDLAAVVAAPVRGQR
eukprot:2306028-Rhodomonas_salina.1